MAGQVVIREATKEDRKALFEWRNDQTLNSVYAPKELQTYQDHCRWFDDFLNDPDRVLLIGVLETFRIGGVRFTRSGNEFELHMFLKPTFAGKGYGTALLEEAIVYLTQIETPQRIFARVEIMNPATLHTYDGAGFTAVCEEGSYLHFEWTP